jgi:hypothetical protein
VDILFLWVLVAIQVFLAKQLYIALRFGELNVSSGVYSRRRTPVRYWAALFTLVSGITFLFLVIFLIVAAWVMLAFS